MTSRSWSASTVSAPTCPLRARRGRHWSKAMNPPDATRTERLERHLPRAAHASASARLVRRCALRQPADARPTSRLDWCLAGQAPGPSLSAACTPDGHGEHLRWVSWASSSAASSRSSSLAMPRLNAQAMYTPMWVPHASSPWGIGRRSASPCGRKPWALRLMLDVSAMARDSHQQGVMLPMPDAALLSSSRVMRARFSTKSHSQMNSRPRPVA